MYSQRVPVNAASLWFLKGVVLLCGFVLGHTHSVRADFLVSALQPISGGSSSRAYGLNNNGLITGDSNTLAGSAVQALRTDGQGSTLSLGVGGGGATSTGFAINNGNQIVGQTQSLTPDGPVTHAFLYSSAKQGTQILAGLTAGGSAVAHSIGDGGVIAGSAVAIDGLNHAVTWDLEGNIKDLGTLAGVGASQAFAVNASGQVTGFSTVAKAGYQAFLYSPGKVPSDPGQLKSLGSLTGNGASQGNAINTQGDVAGWSLSNTGYNHAFAYLNNQLLDLQGSQFAGWNSTALAINSADWIVGKLYRDNSTSMAFLWTPESGMVSLSNQVSNASGWSLQAASAINDHGQIAGCGTLNGLTRGFLLDPITPAGKLSVPEPSSVWLLGMAAAIFCLRSSGRRTSLKRP